MFYRDAVRRSTTGAEDRRDPRRERNIIESLKAAPQFSPKSTKAQLDRVGDGDHSSVSIASFLAIKRRKATCDFMTARHVRNGPSADMIVIAAHMIIAV